MSSALGIAAVTSVLKDLLENQLIERGITDAVGDVTVTATSPDRVPVGAEERNQLNLFLYRVTPHTRWRGTAPPDPGKQAESAPHPTLLLDLHYLLTAYGEQDFQAEILLGFAVQLLLETPILTPEAVRAGLETGARNGKSGGSTGPRGALAASGLAEQGQEIAVVPEFLGAEESSKLWSTLQARYRPSMAYQISAVAIEAAV